MKKIFISAALLIAAATAWGQYALPKISVTNVRSHPRHSAELVSQVVMGTPLKVLSDDGSWLQVETPEGYKGYVITNTLSKFTEPMLTRWQSAPRVVVSSVDQTWVYDNPTEFTTVRRVTDVVPGVILETDGPAKGRALPVSLPDGRKGYIACADVTPVEKWASRATSSAPDSVVAIAPSMMGAPYVWGGTSVKGADCSGYSQLLYYRQGILLPRDAWQQAQVGTLVLTRHSEPVTEKLLKPLRPGDLLFFGNASTRKVTHVGIYRGNGEVIHCSSRVKVNSLIPGAKGYDKSLNLLLARRIEGDAMEKLAVKSRAVYGIK